MARLKEVNEEGEMLGNVRKLREVLSWSYEKAPAVRSIFEKAGLGPNDIKSLKDLTKLPTLTKEELIELERDNIFTLGGFLTVAFNDLKWVFVSPGPVYEPLPDISVLAEMFLAHGFKKGDVVLNSFSYHLVPAGLLFDSALRKVGATVIPAGVGNTDLQVQIMRDLGVTGYVGTPSFLATLVDRAQDMGYDFKKIFKLRLASVTGEMLPSDLRQKLQHEYGIAVRQFYGTAEIGTIGYECSEQEGLHILEDAVIVEIIDPQTGRQLGPGEMGEVVVTSLNRLFPVIRFRTGDLSCYLEGACKCGKTSPRLKGILGRIGEAKKVRGLFLHPKQLKEVVSKLPEITRIQALIGRRGYRDELKLKAELGSLYYGRLDEHERIAEKLESKFKELCRLKVDEIEFVREGSINENEPMIVDERGMG